MDPTTYVAYVPFTLYNVYFCSYFNLVIEAMHRSLRNRGPGNHYYTYFIYLWHRKPTLYDITNKKKKH